MALSRVHTSANPITPICLNEVDLCVYVYLYLTSGVLFYCIRPTKRHSRCLQVALRCLADVNNVSAEGTHVFQLMCEKADECTPMCLIMLDEGADPNAADQVTN